jgi:predicted transcriptional regulator
MSDDIRFQATTLPDELRKQERSISWLARKCDVSRTLMHYIVTGERTASAKVAGKAAKALGKDIFLLFDITRALESTNEMERVA